MNNRFISAHSCVYGSIAVSFLTMLQGCSNDTEAYKLGYHQAQLDMEAQASLIRQSLKESMVLQLSFASVVLSMIIWKGSEVLERIRAKLLTGIMHITVRHQLVIITCIYATGTLFLLAFSCYRYGMPYVFPILIASSCSFYLFVRYAIAFAAGETDRRDSYATKPLKLLSFCVIVVLIYEILSESGFLGLSIDVL